ncbi:MAG: hypothetical protein QM539_10855, partial [Alphaproteobacteria bacterium]|nr:hypothetical protein [Alphaproteobacteria bacterium]
MEFFINNSFNFAAYLKTGRYVKEIKLIIENPQTEITVLYIYIESDHTDTEIKQICTIIYLYYNHLISFKRTMKYLNI